MKKTVYFLVLLVCCINLNAQYGESIRSGRPGQAIGPFTVGQGIFQQQSGVDFSKYGLDDVSYSFSSTLLNNVFRYGVTERFELGIGLDWRNDKQTGQFGNLSQNGISAFSIRARSNLYVGKGLIPTIGCQVNLGLPFVSSIYRTENVAPKITIMTGQQLGASFGFTTNFGALWNGYDNNSTKFYIINLGYSLTNKIGLFIENYGFLQKGQFDSKFDGGLDYLITNNLKLDLSAGYDKNDFTNEMFISFGVSWRTARKEKE